MPEQTPTPEPSWGIKVARASTTHGATPEVAHAAVAAYASHTRPSDSLTLTSDEQEVSCLVSPAGANPVANAVLRGLELAAQALGELYNDTADPLGDAALALTFSEHRPFVALSLEDARGGLADRLRHAGHYELAQWCAEAPCQWLRDANDWRALTCHDQVVWVSADSLLNPAALSAHADRSVATELHSDGLVLGEAATAIWLTRTPDPDAASLTWTGRALPSLDRELPALAPIQPATEGIVNLLAADPRQQAAWYRWLDQYRINPLVDLDQRYWLTPAFGGVGAAGPGLGILCGLGRLNLPCPELPRLWVLNQDSNNRYDLIRLDSPRQDKTPEQQGASHG